MPFQKVPDKVRRDTFYRFRVNQVERALLDGAGTPVRWRAFMVLLAELLRAREIMPIEQVNLVYLVKHFFIEVDEDIPNANLWKDYLKRIDIEGSGTDEETEET